MSTTTSVINSATSTTPILRPRLPLFTRISYGLNLYLFKAFVTTALSLFSLSQRLKRAPTLPTLTRTFPSRPSLTCRLFYPQNNPHPTTPLPCYISIHGGGFALCEPFIDDAFAQPFANQHNLLVISINYRKAPRYAFPIPVHDCAAIVRDILSASSDLPIDTSRIALGGFSAGGNLSLAIAQFSDIAEKISAVIPVYPVVDLSNRYKGEYRKTADGKPDILEKSGKWFDWGYIPVDTDRTDPLLSPIYADPKLLPRRLFLVGCEYDVLNREAELMARKCAGEDIEGRDVKEEIEEQWEKEGVKWRMVKGMQHGFTHQPARGEKEVARRKLTEELWAEMGTWLVEGWKK